MDIQKEVVDYLREGMMLGYPLEFLKKELLEEGYTPAEVKEYVKALDPEKVKRIKRMLEFAWIGAAIGTYVAVVALVSLSSGADMIPVLVGFSPTLFSILGAIMIVESQRFPKDTVWVLPLVFSTLFFLIGSLGVIPIIESLEVAGLSMLNAATSFVFLAIAGILGVLRPDIHYTLVDTSEEDDTLDQNLLDIQRDAKKINDAIGKVYKNANGGSAQLRNNLRIMTSWTNDLNVKDLSIVAKAIVKIQDRLGSYYKQEGDIFPKAKLKNIDRDPSGISRIVDVLIDNTSQELQVTLENILNTSQEALKKINN